MDILLFLTYIMYPKSNVSEIKLKIEFKKL